MLNAQEFPRSSERPEFAEGESEASGCEVWRGPSEPSGEGPAGPCKKDAGLGSPPSPVSNDLGSFCLCGVGADVSGGRRFGFTSSVARAPGYPPLSPDAASEEKAPCETGDQVSCSHSVMTFSRSKLWSLRKWHLGNDENQQVIPPEDTYFRYKGLNVTKSRL